MENMIEINRLVKRYGANFAVNDISFTVKKGEIVGFLGPNGAGKSTTMNILTGYLSATSGEAKVAGIDILENPIEAKKHIGFLPEHPPLYLDMTVKEYLGFVYDLKGCNLPKKQHIAEICSVMKIEDVFKRPIAHLSKGYKQRVGVAQALIGNPDILILDEPTVGLDPNQIIEIRNLISSLGKKHTIILSSHILPEVQAVCDRVIIINKGQIVADEKTENLNVITGSRKYFAKITGKPENVINIVKDIPGVVSCVNTEQKELDTFTYLIESQTDSDIRKMLFRAVADNGLCMIGLEPAYANLEDVFISLVNNK